MEELNARAFASQRGSPRCLRLGEWRPMNWGIQYIYGVAIGAGYRIVPGCIDELSASHSVC